MHPMQAAEAAQMQEKLMKDGVTMPHFKATKKVLWTWIMRHGSYLQRIRDLALKEEARRDAAANPRKLWLPYKE